jgi:hypothetical protein
MSNRRFIELSSSYRNRVEYPNPASFDVPFSPSQPRNQYETTRGTYTDSNGVLHKITSIHTTQSDTVTNGIVEYLWNWLSTFYSTGTLSVDMDSDPVISINTPMANIYNMTPVLPLQSYINATLIVFDSTTNLMVGQTIITNAVSFGPTIQITFTPLLTLNINTPYLYTVSNVYGAISSVSTSSSSVSTSTSLSSVLNYYVGYKMNFYAMGSASLGGIIITSYNPATSTFTLASPPPSSATYITISDPSTTTLFTLPAVDLNGKTILSYRQSYNNYYVIDETLSSGTNIIYTDVLSYDVFTRSLTLAKPLSLYNKYSLRKTLPNEFYSTVGMPSLSGLITLQTNSTTIFATGLTSTFNYNGFQIKISDPVTGSTLYTVTLSNVVFNSNTNNFKLKVNSSINLSVFLNTLGGHIPQFLPFTITPVFNEQLSVTSSCLFLPSTANQTDNFYTGKYIYIYPSPGLNIEGSCFFIQSYIGNGYNACFLTTVNTPTVNGATSYYPSYNNTNVQQPQPGTLINIVSFSNDNYNPLIYNGSTVSQQETVAYEISLLSLNLPNITLTTGSNIAFYPYVYVEFSVINKQAPNIIYSNNPKSTKALFLVNVRDIKDKRITPFIKLSGKSMTQTVKFKPNDCLRFSVFLPNGQLFQTIESDYYSPSAPNPFVQIDALFGIDRLA